MTFGPASPATRHAMELADAGYCSARAVWVELGDVVAVSGWEVGVAR